MSTHLIYVDESHDDELFWLSGLAIKGQSRAVIIADEEITRVMRKMTVYNPIPSAYGSWLEGVVCNKPTQRLIEDPVFRSSKASYLLQLVDCVAFALLKREAVPTPNIRKYKIHEMFDNTLASVCVKAASRSDPLGIVRS